MPATAPSPETLAASYIPMTDKMMILGILAAPCLGVAVSLIVRKHIKRVNIWFKCIIWSFIYALFFGLGALGDGGGEPGFLIPAPVLSAAFLDTKNLVHNSILPFLFWWVIILAFLLLKQIYVHVRQRRVPL